MKKISTHDGKVQDGSRAVVQEKSRKNLKLQDLPLFAKALCESFHKRQIVSLVGDLGSGKTELVRHILQTLGVLAPVSSPTYSLIHSYSLKNFKQMKDLKIHHVDLYRVVSPEDLESFGFWDLFLDKKSFIFIEWAQKWSHLFPLDWPQMRIQISPSTHPKARDYFVCHDPLT